MHTLSLQTCELGDESSFPRTPRGTSPALPGGLAGHQRGRVPGIAADGRAAPRPPGAGNPFSRGRIVSLCARQQPLPSLWGFIFVANPELLTTACFPFDALLPSAVQPCLPPFQNLGFISDFLRFLLGFPGGSATKNPPANAGDAGLTPGSGRCRGGGNGNPLQYSCLENPTDRGAWRDTVHGVAKSRTRLSIYTRH